MPAIKPINITGACLTHLPLVKSGATSRRRIGPAAWRWRFKAFALVIGLHLFWWANAGAAVNVLTWHNDNFRTGQNTNETMLTPANVNTNTFGLLFSYPVDGKVYAQPLYVAGLPIPGLGTRNVVFIATQHDSVYAFDADGTNGLIWQVSLGTSATTPNNDFGNRYGPYHDID